MSAAGPERQFQDFLALGKFMIQRSRGSGACVFYPRLAEPGSGAEDLEWVEASGAGTVYSVTVSRPRPPEQPFNIVLVDLAEGPRLLSRVEGIAPEAVRIGMKVQARIAAGPPPHVVFDPA